jgi:hypothetical protein
MSGIALIPSGLPPGPDLVSGPVLRGLLTQPGHTGDEIYGHQHTEIQGLAHSQLQANHSGE